MFNAGMKHARRLAFALVLLPSLACAASEQESAAVLIEDHAVREARAWIVAGRVPLVPTVTVPQPLVPEDDGATRSAEQEDAARDGVE